MSFNKWIEITCDHCGNSDYFIGGSYQSANKEWVMSGGLLNKIKNEHFCNAECLALYIKK